MKEGLSNIIEATATMPMGVDKIIFFIDYPNSNDDMFIYVSL